MSMFNENITIDMRRLRMRDINALEENKESGGSLSSIIPILARVTNKTEDEVWDWDFETMMKVQTELDRAMKDIVKKTSGEA